VLEISFSFCNLLINLLASFSPYKALILSALNSEATNYDNRLLSWEDVFEGRLFTSFITKESNVHDRFIGSYATGIDNLLESDRIKQEMFEFEHDLWTY
jgi:hypothetical protein